MMQQSYLTHMFNVSKGLSKAFIKTTSTGYKINVSHQGLTTGNDDTLPIPRQSLLFKTRKTNESDISLIEGGPNKTIHLKDNEYIYIKSRLGNNETQLTKIVPDINSLTITKDRISENGTITNKVYKLIKNKYDFNLTTNKTIKDHLNKDLSERVLYNKTSIYDPITTKIIERYTKTSSNGLEITEYEDINTKTTKTIYLDGGSIETTENKLTGGLTINYKDRNNKTTHIDKTNPRKTTTYLYSPNGDLIWKEEETRGKLKKTTFNDDGTVKHTHTKELLGNGNTIEEIKESNQRNVLLKHNGVVKQSIFQDSNGFMEVMNYEENN